jgi:hypothetical protein
MRPDESGRGRLRVCATDIFAWCLEELLEETAVIVYGPALWPALYD